jgi:hypothetical protein
MQTSFHHQPEAQHPKSPAIETPAGRLPHLWEIADMADRQYSVIRHYANQVPCPISALWI